MTASFSLSLAQSTSQQGASQLTIGGVISGALELGDEQRPGFGLVDRIPFTAQAGEGVWLQGVPSSGLLMMQVSGPGGLHIRSSGTGDRSRPTIEFLAPETGEYLVQVWLSGSDDFVAAIGRQQTGQYTLTTRQTVEPSASTRRRAQAPVLTVGRATRGRIDDNDWRMPNGRPVDYYAYDGQAGEVIQIDVTGGGLSAWIEGPNGFSSTDTTYPTTRFAAALSESALYRIAVVAGAPSIRGSYSVAVSRLSAAVFADTAAPQGTLNIGQSVSGQTASGDPRRPNGAPADVYAFEGRAGEEIEIRVNASGYRPHVQIDGPGAFSESSNRDPYSAQAEQNSRLAVRLPVDGTYRIQASAVGSHESGSYTLSIVDGVVAARERAEMVAAVPDLFRRASVALNAGDNASAIALYRQGLNLVLDANAYNDLGVAQFRSGDYFGARLSFETAVAHNPNHPHARANLLAAERAYNDRQAQRQQAFDQNEARQRQENARAWSMLGAIVGAYVQNEAQRTFETRAEASSGASGGSSACTPGPTYDAATCRCSRNPGSVGCVEPPALWHYEHENGRGGFQCLLENERPRPGFRQTGRRCFERVSGN